MADIMKGKDSLMKRLLSTAPSISVSSSMPSYGDYPSNLPSPTSDSSEEASTNLILFLRQLANQSGRELNIIVIDHAYAKASNWRSENTFAQPTKNLFVLPVLPPQQAGVKSNVELDIESVPDIPLAPYDVAAVSVSMSESEGYIDCVNPGEPSEDWEDQIDKSRWTTIQQQLFGKMMRALHSDRLARLTYTGSWKEPMQRRTIIDRTARRVRHLLSCHNWEATITQWLHTTMLENLCPIYLAIYLDVLQTMRTKAPSLVDRMIASSPVINRPGLSGLESLNVVLRQPWDPVASSLNDLKPRRLPGNPLLITVPSTPLSSNAAIHRHKQWESYFSSLGSLVPVSVKSDPETAKASLLSCLDQMMCATRLKISHLRAEYPKRPIILIGSNAGASAACHIALVEPVSAVVCLGFAVNTVEGKRGDPSDTLLDLPCPVIFVIGENAATAQCADLEDIRVRMKVETGLVVVGSADDLLRVSCTKKLAHGITQRMVDRCILEEVGNFLGGILMNPRPLSIRSSSTTGLLSSDMPNNSIIKIEKRKNPSSEPSSPAVKRSRPGTPLHGTSTPVTTSAPATPPTSKSLTTLPTLVSVSGTKGPRQKPRMTAAQKLQSNPGSPEVKWAAQMPTCQQVGSNPDQTMSTTQGITVNIGSLGSLTPLGPIRLTQTASSTASGSMTTNNQPLGDATSLTIQGNLISSGNSNSAEKVPTSVGRGGGTSAKAHQPAAGRGTNKPSDTGTLTSLSSLLQGSPATRIMVSSASSLLTTASQANQQLKAAGCEENLTDASSSNVGARMRATSGRMLDLSKLTVLTPTSTSSGKNLLGASSGNVVMLAESPRAGRSPSGGGPLLVPVSTVSSPFTLVPLSNKTSRTGGDRSPNQRSYTVIPKITVPSLKLNHPQVSVTGSKLPYSLNPTLLRSSTSISSVPPSPEGDTAEAGPKEDDDVLSAAKILELPIIFAKDGEDPIFSEDKMGTDSLEPPTVVPISSCGSGEGSSSVTLGDTISFPLDPDLENEKTSSSGRTVPNVFIIRSKNTKERSTSKRIVQKTQRFIRTVDKMQPPQENPSHTKTASGIKYTKIILTNRNSSSKDHDEALAGNGVSVRHDQLQSIEPEEGTGSNEDMNLKVIDHSGSTP